MRGGCRTSTCPIASADGSADALTNEDAMSGTIGTVDKPSPQRNLKAAGALSPAMLASSFPGQTASLFQCIRDATATFD